MYRIATIQYDTQHHKNMISYKIMKYNVCNIHYKIVLILTLVFVMLKVGTLQLENPTRRYTLVVLNVHF